MTRTHEALKWVGEKSRREFIAILAVKATNAAVAKYRQNRPAPTDEAIFTCAYCSKRPEKKMLSVAGYGVHLRDVRMVCGDCGKDMEMATISAERKVTVAVTSPTPTMNRWSGTKDDLVRFLKSDPELIQRYRAFCSPKKQLQQIERLGVVRGRIMFDGFDLTNRPLHIANARAIAANELKAAIQRREATKTGKKAKG